MPDGADLLYAFILFLNWLTFNTKNVPICEDDQNVSFRTRFPSVRLKFLGTVPFFSFKHKNPRTQHWRLVWRQEKIRVMKRLIVYYIELFNKFIIEFFKVICLLALTYSM